MTLFRKIVVLLDTDPASRRVLGVARALSTQWQIPALLVSAVTSDDAIPAARARLTSDAEGFTQPVDVEVHRSPSTRRGLLTVLGRETGAVVVMATHAQHPVRELVLGSVADDLVRTSPLPIVLVGPHADPPQAGGYGELLACVDGGERSAGLLEMLRDAGDLHMSTAVLEVRPPGGRSTGGAIERSVAAGAGIAHVVAHHDRPARGILDTLADRPGALPVIATEGRDPYARLRVPSTALAVTREASVPVLVVGPACEADWLGDQRLERA